MTFGGVILHLTSHVLFLNNFLQVFAFVQSANSTNSFLFLRGELMYKLLSPRLKKKSNSDKMVKMTKYHTKFATV